MEKILNRVSSFKKSLQLLKMQKWKKKRKWLLVVTNWRTKRKFSIHITIWLIFYRCHWGWGKGAWDLPKSQLLIVWAPSQPSSFLLHPTLYPAHIWSCKTNRAFIYFSLHKCRKYLHLQGKYLCIFKVDSKTNWIYKLKQIYMSSGQCLSEALVVLYTWKQAKRFKSEEVRFHWILSSCFWRNLCSSLPFPFISSNDDTTSAKTHHNGTRCKAEVIWKPSSCVSVVFEEKGMGGQWAFVGFHLHLSTGL